MDKNSWKRKTIYDQACLALFKDSGSSVPSSSVGLSVNEDDLRLAIEDIHDSVLAQEYSKQERLLARVIEL